VADAQQTGERIAYHRKRLGLSQVEFAGLIGRSDSWVSQVERGVRAIDRLSVFQKVADVLSVPVAELRGADPDEAEAADRPEALEALRFTLTGHPAIRTVLGEKSQALAAARLDELQSQRTDVWEMVHAAQYFELAAYASTVIPELENAVRAESSAETGRATRELLTNTYQAVAAILARLGEADAAWIAADRATFIAETLAEPLEVAASLYRMTHAFLTLSQIGQAQIVATTVVSELEQQSTQDPSMGTMSLCGAFHLVLAIAAARSDDRAQAHQHLDRAKEIADRIGGDRDDFGTEFGATNVALHAVAVAVELGDAGQALDLARYIEPSALSLERQARYALDLAQAHVMRRQTGEALRCLEQAERLTPEQTRTHRVARAVVRDLIQLSGSRPRPELRELAERLGVLP
jgi:transcriptional regulator with XRE-family HTH domain